MKLKLHIFLDRRQERAKRVERNRAAKKASKKQKQSGKP